MTEVQKPTPLPVQLAQIPETLKTLERWILWRYIPKRKPNGDIHWAKVPYQASGREAKSNDPNTWTDYDSACDALIMGGDDGKAFDGLGFVFSDDDDLAGIDLDDCIDPDTGEYSAVARELLERVDGYAEVSPSGTGIKLFTRAEIARAHKNNDIGIEVYKTGRYFTVTGHQLNGHEQLPTEAQDLGWFIEKHFGQRAARQATTPEDAFEMYRPPLDGWDLERTETELLHVLDPDMGHDNWLNVGMALHHQFRGDPEALTLWDTWSAGGAKYVEGECEERWRSFSQQRFQGHGAVTLASIIWLVRQQNMATAAAAGQLVLDPKDYMRCARELVERKFSGPEGLVLRHVSDLWYRHAITHYREIEDNTVRKACWEFLDGCHKPGRGGAIVRFVPGPQQVNGTLDAMRAKCHLEQARPPMWLDGAVGPDPKEVVSLKNGLFHIPSQTLLPHTAGFFTLNTLPFEWDPMADAPTWRKFLDDVWGEDQESIDTLQEMLGYLIAADTSMQKIFMLIGPKRSGKGTIGRVINALLGAENITGPTLSSLTQQFGLQPLIGKLVAMVADARAPGKDHQLIVERLLMMSGEDLITVDRKNLDAWVGNLTARVVIMTNEALQLGDASGALVGRLVVLAMKNSFYGREDRTLTSKLLAELPGIFNWALEGRARLYARGHFVQPAAGVEMVEEMQDLNSPMSEFLERCCERSPDAHEDQSLVYEAWRRWCLKNERRPGTKALFSKQLYAAAPWVSLLRPRVDGEQVRAYAGVRLKKAVRDLVVDSFLGEQDDPF